MPVVSISPKFQIVIPKEVREKLDIASGTKVEIIPYEKRMEVIPLTKIKNLKGALKGMDTNIKREKDRL